MMWAVKLSITMLIGAVLFHATRQWLLGRKLVKPYDPAILAQHRSATACLGCVTFIAVIVIEVMVRISPSQAEIPSGLAWVHFAFDALLVVLFLAIVLRFTGLFNSTLHHKLGYAMYAALGVTIVTGSALLYMY